MRNLLVTTLLGVALTAVLCGCPQITREQPAPQKSLLKCSTCGVEITDPEGLEKHRQEAHPDQKH